MNITLVYTDTVFQYFITTILKNFRHKQRKIKNMTMIARAKKIPLVVSLSNWNTRNEELYAIKYHIKSALQSPGPLINRSVLFTKLRNGYSFIFYGKNIIIRVIAA